MTWAWLAKVSAGVWGKLLAGLAIAGGILLALSKLKQAGRDAERADQAQRNEEIRRQADEVRDRVDASGSTELDDSVRKWTRPD